MDKSQAGKGKKWQADVAGCADLSVEDQRSILGGLTWSEGFVLGAAFVAGLGVAPELLAAAAVVGVYQIATQ
jgi:hypothetical protein